MQFLYYFSQENFDIDISWKRGVALISAMPTCLRVVCLLCGSGGQHEVCNIDDQFFKYSFHS